MLLSVVIVNWNSRDDLRRCLESLRGQTHRELEIIVVDNGSEDGSVEMMRRDFPEATLIEAGENLGFAEGCNRGIELSHGDWVAMLNNDTLADSNWAAELVNAARQAPPACGMLQSLLLFLSKQDVINSTGIALTRAARGYDRDGGRPRSQTPQPGEIFCPTAGAAAYRRTMLDSLKLPDGWFDRRHFMYLEDLDLGWRARLAGFEARFVPSSFVLHKHHGSSDRHGLSWLEVISRINRIRTLIKNGSIRFWIETLFITGMDLVDIVRHGGFKALKTLAEAVPSSLESRSIIKRMLKVSRGSVEKRWTD
jgi:GT2 family glycosyltransferase